jgi:hypothetical protein
LTPAAESKQSQPLPELQLLEHVPAAGLRWLVHTRPASLARDQALMESLSPLFTPERLEAYARETRLDLRKLEDAAIAGFDLGTLYLASSEQDTTPVLEAFAERFVAGAEVATPHPQLARISGVVGQTPQSMLSHQRRWVAVASGDPMLVRVVEAYALGKLKRSPPALAGVALKSLSLLDDQAPVVLYVPGPFDKEWAEVAHGALASAHGLVLLATPHGDQSVRLRLVVDGAFEDSSSVAARLLAAWDEFSSTSTGRLFALDRPLQAARVDNTRHRVTLSVRLRLKPVVSGLFDAVSAEARDIFEMR